ncbi:Mor transcription activator family protein [Salipiger marinus]|uniref:Mor transcription activator family protein n=1 Tax=Salipiger marinus TaxID=555512 RepID=UPI002C0875AE|nr:Mor transcription activator family protein [Salipiger manganoxidans]MEB3417571.1 Mor transcription activator family protein [Salipiger manganoxidans]
MNDLSFLPEILLGVAEELGVGVALKLMQHYGGQEVYFAKKPSAELVELFGDAQAAALCHHFGGQPIYVPHGKVQRRRQEVGALAAKGHDSRAIARYLGISQRHVRRLANAPPGQLSLFPDED